MARGGDPRSAQRTRLLRDIHRLSGRPAEGAFRLMLRALSSIVGSDDSPTRLREAQAQIQLPVSTGRRIAVVGASGGAGTSSLAVLLAQAVNHARGGGSRLVTATEHEVLHWLNGDSGSEVGVSVHGERRTDLATAVAEHSRRSPVTIIECGRSPEQVRAVQPHVVVVVGRRTVRGIELVQTLLASLDVKVPVVTVLREVPDSGMPRRRSGARPATEGPGDGLVLLPHDRHVAGEAGLRLALTGEPTLVAIRELAGLVMKRSVLG